MANLGEGCIIQGSSTINTGIENDCALGLAAGVIMVPSGRKFTKADMADPVDFFTDAFHADASLRMLPVFKGYFDFAVARESAVTEANPLKGTTRTIRTGGFTFTYTWESGGLCLAQQLAELQGRGYSVIFVDQDSKFLMQKNADGTFSGLNTTDITSDFLPQSPTTSTKNILVFSVGFKDYVRAKVFNSDVDLTDLNGLVEAEVIKVSNTTTKLIVDVKTECAGSDLVAKYPTAIADLENFIVRRISPTVAVITPTSIAVVSGHVELTVPTLTAGTYTVELATPAILLSNNIAGYDGTIKAQFIVT